MKLLTLNTHSWVEIHQLHKIKILADFIIEQNIDVVALQEVNQNFIAPLASEPESFAGSSPVALRADNFALLLTQFLEAAGAHYTWGWGDSHQGWDIYDEGIALLSRYPVKTLRNLELSEPRFTYTDVFRRCALAAELEINGHSLWIATAHMNWWIKHDLRLFEHDFARLDQQMRTLAGDAPVILLGDFNNDATVQDEGYTQMIAAGWFDAFTLADEREGEFTVHKAISGWEEEAALQAMRIDYVLFSAAIPVQRYEVVFPDHTPQAISDHSGVLVSLESAELFPDR